MKQTLLVNKMMVLKHVFLFAFVLLSVGVCAQRDSMDYKGKSISVITKFADADLPPALIYQIRNYTKEQILGMKEEYQQNVKEDDGEYVVTMKMWFEDDHVVGFLKKAPMRNSLKVEVSKTVIDIPIEWCGMVDSLKQLYCVKTLKELQDFAATTKTSDWHQKPDEVPAAAEPFGNAATLKKKIKKAGLKDSIAKVKDEAKLSKKDMKKKIIDSYKNGEEKDSTGQVIKPAFAKPEEDKKKSKKDKNAVITEVQDSSAATVVRPTFAKPEENKKKSKKDKKAAIVEAQDSTAAPVEKPAFAKPEEDKKKSKKDKKAVIAEVQDSTAAPVAKPSFGKPEDTKKKSKKDKKNTPAPLDEPVASDSTIKKGR